MASVTCPKCGAQECHPTDKDKILIRAFKVHHNGCWHSQCLVCAGYYNADLTVKPVGKDGINPDYDTNAGWFGENVTPQRMLKEGRF